MRLHHDSKTEAGYEDTFAKVTTDAAKPWCANSPDGKGGLNM